MMTLEEILEALKDHRPEDVAAGTGLSYWTVIRYRDGRAKEPPHDTVSRLSEYLIAANADSEEGAT